MRYCRYCGSLFNDTYEGKCTSCGGELSKPQNSEDAKRQSEKIIKRLNSYECFELKGYRLAMLIIHSISTIGIIIAFSFNLSNTNAIISFIFSIVLSALLFIQLIFSNQIFQIKKALEIISYNNTEQLEPSELYIICENIWFIVAFGFQVFLFYHIIVK